LLKLATNGEILNVKDTKTLAIFIKGVVQLGTIYMGIMPNNMKLSSVTIKTDTSPVGSPILLDVLKNGTSVIMSNIKLESASTFLHLDLTPILAFNKDDIIEIKVNSVGTSQIGSNLLINFEFNIIWWKGMMIMNKLQLCVQAVTKVYGNEEISFEEAQALYNYFCSGLCFINLENAKIDENMNSDELKHQIEILLKDTLVQYYKCMEGLTL